MITGCFRHHRATKLSGPQTSKQHISSGQLVFQNCSCPFSAKQKRKEAICKGKNAVEPFLTGTFPRLPFPTFTASPSFPRCIWDEKMHLDGTPLGPSSHPTVPSGWIHASGLQKGAALPPSRRAQNMATWLAPIHFHKPRGCNASSSHALGAEEALQCLFQRELRTLGLLGWAPPQFHNGRQYVLH